MSSALQRAMTMADFLEWEERQEFKHEFDGYGPVAIAGGSLAHAELQRNLAISVGGPLRGTPCQFTGSDYQLRLDNRVRYPDGAVICGPQDRASRGTSAPVVIFEVLSPSTASTDRILKAREYQATPSVQRYVMLEQDRIGATVFARVGEGWSGQVLAAGDRLDMPEVGLSMGLDELYDGIGLADLPGEQAAHP